MELRVETGNERKIKPKGFAQFSLTLRGVSDPSRVQFTVRSMSLALESRWLNLEVGPVDDASRPATLRVQANGDEQLPAGTHAVHVGARDERSRVRSTATCIVVVKKLCVLMPEPPSFSLDSSGNVQVSIKLSNCGDSELTASFHVRRRRDGKIVGFKPDVSLDDGGVDIDLTSGSGTSGGFSILDCSVDILADGQLVTIASRRFARSLRYLRGHRIIPVVNLLIALATLGVLIGYVFTSGSGSPTTTSGVPTPPSALSASPGPQRVVLSWTPPGSDGGHSVTGYEIYQATDPTLTKKSPAGSATAPGTSYTVTGLKNGSTYFFVVQALNSVGRSSRSNEAYAVPSAASPPPVLVPTTTPTIAPTPSPTPVVAPSVPTHLTPKAGDGEVTLSWQEASPTGGAAISSYDIYEGRSIGSLALVGSVSSLTTRGAVPTTYVALMLTNGAQYFFAVSAVNSGGASSPKSQAATATPVAEFRSAT
jgi:hypothetical protein